MLAVLVAFGASILMVATYGFAMAATYTGAVSSPELQWSSHPNAPRSSVVPTLSNFVVGLVGVLAGTLCLERAERAIGSMVLLVLGVGFEISVLGSAHGEFHFPRGAIATGIGGLVAVVFFFWRRPRSQTPVA